MNKPTSDQPPAVEPAQRCNCCGYLVTDSEHRGCLRAAKQEPAQAVPFAWVLECMTSIGTTCWMLSWNRSGVGSCNRLHGQDHEKPLYTAPPAIDDETKRMVLELCRLIIDKAGPDSMITRAMAQKAEKISERLEAGE